MEKKNLVTQEEKLSPPSGQASGCAQEIYHVADLSEVEVINGQKSSLNPITNRLVDIAGLIESVNICWIDVPETAPIEASTVHFERLDKYCWIRQSVIPGEKNT